MKRDRKNKNPIFQRGIKKNLPLDTKLISRFFAGEHIPQVLDPTPDVKHVKQGK